MFARFLTCSVAVVGITLTFPANATGGTAGALPEPLGAAGALPASCSSTLGTSMTIVDGLNACGTESDISGLATAYGLGGVGYAKALAGAMAVGIGLDGGVGASEGEGGMPAALGIGPGSVAIASVSHGALSVAIAMNDSQALVADADQGVICQGTNALAWNVAAGLVCLATPMGIWTYH